MSYIVVCPSKADYIVIVLLENLLNGSIYGTPKSQKVEKLGFTPDKLGFSRVN